MNSPDILIADSLSSYQDTGKTVKVALSNALVRLLSEQLYQSPLKAIEELVVNAYDANAAECRIYIPLLNHEKRDLIVVYDDGQGMDYAGLVNLWQIGRSNKRDEEIERRSRRKQIGKFGIGKLATYTIANQLTYVSKTAEGIMGVTIDFTNFKDEAVISNTDGVDEDAGRNEAGNENVTSNDSTAEISPITLPVYEIEDLDDFFNSPEVQVIFDGLGLETTPSEDSWTIAILENLKQKSDAIKRGSLEWVLKTAMPLGADFQVFLNGEALVSSKEDYEKVVEFDLTDLPAKRLEGLSKETGEEWIVEGCYLKSKSFPSGIQGNVILTRRSLYGQKSDDIQRSHGFFVRVCDRLVDLADPLFGMQPIAYGTLNRLHADVRADDLDAYLTASRDTVEESEIKVTFRKLLREISNEADVRWQAIQREEENSRGDKKPKKEGEKELVAPRLVEYSVADALLTQRYDTQGAEANEAWFYISVPAETNANDLAQQLYTSPRSKYRYTYSAQGIDRLAKFDPADSTFWINSEHELVKEYAGDDSSRRLLEDFVTAEMLLEVYLRENHVPAHLIGEVLQKRDDLLRSLTQDHSYSLATISQRLREAASDEHELEINLVVAARAIGFIANQISGPGEPDGLARYVSYSEGEKKIILEAKASKKDKRPEDIDFAALHRHMVDKRYKADGCLLVAPGYIGGEQDSTAVAENARQQKISCWTVEQLARVVEAAESRHIGAKDIVEMTPLKKPGFSNVAWDHTLNFNQC